MPNYHLYQKTLNFAFICFQKTSISVHVMGKSNDLESRNLSYGWFRSFQRIKIAYLLIEMIFISWLCLWTLGRCSTTSASINLWARYHSKKWDYRIESDYYKTKQLTNPRHCCVNLSKNYIHHLASETVIIIYPTKLKLYSNFLTTRLKSLI